ncbi:MAG: hypothetical protein K2P81_05315 [Bacteriovoracaceae bacterium]|nr:hypothetical protein [Bacteriovoracaceae bacterium]
MKLILLILLVSCQPQAQLSAVRGGSSLEAESSLIGKWKSKVSALDGCEASCESNVFVIFTETTMKFNFPNYPNSNRTRRIKFVSQNSFYDYSNNEYVTFTIRGSRAQLCYEMGCNDIWK